MTENWYQLDSPAVLLRLEADLHSGLSPETAAERLASHGPNEITSGGTRSPWRILWEQLTALMVVILIVAAVASALLGDYKDALAIGAIVVLNAILGFTQDYRAEQAMAALRKLAVPSVKVRRNGRVTETAATSVVPGDIVLLEAGNLVAADCRILESAGLQAQEASLTGESAAVAKSPDSLPQPDLPLGDRLNMAWMGTFITAGRGLAVVVQTGMATELGRIATLIQTVEREPTPLQKGLTQLGKGLAAAALALVALIFGLGLLRGEEVRTLFLTAVSLAVAAVPEGLPAVVTIALTLGAQRMLQRRVLIRKLPAVEALGSITVICSDKTGTLTQNRMAAVRAEAPDASMDLTADATPLAADESTFRLLLTACALCNDAALVVADGNHEAIGDPTEAALALAAARFGLLKGDLDDQLPRVGELPFSSERKLMTTVHRMPSDRAGLPFKPGSEGSLVAFTKGSFDHVLANSTSIRIGGQAEALTPASRERLSKSHFGLAQNGMRVLALGYRWIPDGISPADSAVEQDLTFAGLIGIIDPARPEAATSVEKCKAAGIRPVMITGDHPLTAVYIAEQLGIGGEGAVLAGPELDTLSAEELDLRSDDVAVYARVSPEHKLKIVASLQRRGHIVAMTGDGVNDAPALRKADIGVAMGVTGTDVAKEAADMVLLDDNFASIVDSVEQGRVIYDNVRKFIRYILATNAGEIFVMLVAPLIGMPLPLLPLQILWMNLVTDGLPALALGVEAPEPHTMRRPPYPPDENIFERGLGRHVIWVGLLMGLVTLLPAWLFWRNGDPNWQTLLFTTITLCQMAHVMAIRSDTHSLFTIGLFSNKALLGAVLLTFILQLALVYVPFLQALFRTTPLPFADFALATGLALIIFVAVELEKWVNRRSTARR